MNKADLLTAIPDFSGEEQATRWLKEKLEILKHCPRASLAGFRSANAPSGSLENTAMRRFARGLLLADWACYETPSARVDFSRLLNALSAFPLGFRLWSCEIEGEEIPVGYTGWYPLAPSTFEIMRTRPQTITHRGFMAPIPALDARPFLYLFNYSIIPPLQGGSEQSRALLAALAKDIRSCNPGGLAAVTVSKTGARVARRFGLEHSGDMMFEGEREEIYTRLFA